MKNIAKRMIAAALSAATMLSSMAIVPTAGAADEDNKASSVEIKVKETYNIWDSGTQKAWFQQNGSPRNVWPMYTKASDGTMIRAYCADHSKTNPGSSSKSYTVTGKVADMHVYGVATRTDSRMTLNEFISWAKAPLTASNFTSDMYFSASQAAIWVALGDAQIAANSNYGVNYSSSTSLGYRASGKTLSASSTSEALTLYAAIKMLEYGNSFNTVWGSGGLNHAPWIGCVINYTPGSSTYNGANSKAGSINLTKGIIGSGIFAEKQIDGQDCMVLPMAAASATFEIRGIDNDYKHSFTTDALGEITVQGRNLPKGSYECYEVAAPEGFVTDGSDIQTFEWNNTKNIELTFKNAPQPAIQIYKYDKDSKMPIAGATFEVRRDGQTLATLKSDVNGYARINNLPKGFFQVVETEAASGYLKDEQVHEVYIDPSADPTQIVREINISNTKKLAIRIVKIDRETKVPLKDWKFDVYFNDSHLTSVTTGSNGEAMVENLQPGTYRIKESGGDTTHYNMDAPEQTVELIKDQAEIPTLTFSNTVKKHFGLLKIDAETHRPISGVTFEVWKDGRLLGNYTTEGSGRIWLPYAEPGTYQVRETVTDPKYVLNEKTFTVENDSEQPTFFTIPNTMKKDVTVTKIDKDTGKPMQGVVFEAFRDGKSIGFYTTGPDGKFTLPYADNGTYVFYERHTLAGYTLSKEPIIIEHTTDGNTDIIIDNTVQKDFTVVKVDSQSKIPIAGVTFSIWRDNVLLGDYQTDSDGKITISKAPAGTYRVQEKFTLQEYILNDKPFEIEHTTEKPTTVTIENTRKPGLLIKKIDAQSHKPLQGAVFRITRGDGSIVREDAVTDSDGAIFLPELEENTYVISEEKAPDSYQLDSTPKTVQLRAGETYEVTFTNTRVYGLQIVKTIKGTNKPLSGCVFKVTKANGEVIGKYTTNSAGLATVSGLEAGVYVVTEISCPEGYRLDGTPQNVIVKAGQLATVEFENEKLASIRIKKIDAVTKKGIYGVRFLVKDESNNLIGEYSTDQDGYIELDDILTDGKSEVKLKVEEIAAAQGYVLDSTVRTLRVRRGETTELVVENTPVLGQIQVVKKSSQDNPITNQLKGSLLQGAVFEIENAETGRIVDTITTDSRGIAASNPLPLGRYFVRESKAPRFFQLNTQKAEVKLKVEGDVVRIEMYDDPAIIKTSITKTGNYTVDAGDNMRYDITNVANQSNVPLDNFFWHDRIPTDAVRVGTITTGTYNARVWYKITYKTNKNGYRTLADHLLSTNRYSFKVDSGSLKLAIGEYVTDIRYEFGTVPAGFKMTEKATVYVYVPSYMGNGYNIINRVDCGGSYQGEWDSSTSAWVTKIHRTPIYPLPTLPKTGY